VEWFWWDWSLSQWPAGFLQCWDVKLLLTHSLTLCSPQTQPNFIFFIIKNMLSTASSPVVLVTLGFVTFSLVYHFFYKYLWYITSLFYGMALWLYYCSYSSWLRFSVQKLTTIWNLHPNRRCFIFIICSFCIVRYYYYYYYKWILLWWRCRITAAGPPYNVTVTFRRLNSNHSICPQLFSRNTKRVRESIHRETLPKQHSFQFLL